MTATPAEGAHAPPAAGQAPAEGGAARANTGPILPVRMIEGASKGIWTGIKAVFGGLWSRTKGVASGVAETTVGQVGAEMKEIGKRLGYETKETELIPMIAAVIEDTGKKIASVVSGVVDFTIGAPTRAIGRTVRGLYNVGRGAILGETYKPGGQAANHEAEVAAHAAGAHGAR